MWKQAEASVGADQGYIGAKGNEGPDGRLVTYDGDVVSRLTASQRRNLCQWVSRLQLKCTLEEVSLYQ